MGFVGGEVDKLAETKGMDYVDKEKAEHRAKKGMFAHSVAAVNLKIPSSGKRC